MSSSLFLPWLGGTLLPLGALWLLWQLALRRERCFGYNRALLLLSPVVAAAWPLLPHPTLPSDWGSATGLPGVAAPAVLLPTLHATAAGIAPGWSGWGWLAALYAAGVALGLGRLAYRYAQLGRRTRHLPREQRAGYALAYTGGQLPTSSFGRTVFWDDTAALTPAEAAPVLAHELAHVRQGHSYDVLWLELWLVVLWPNPFAHLLLPALRLTHELLADRAALAAPVAAAAPVAYPTLLARLAARQLVPASYSPLLQPFTFSFTLTRIAMLQSKHPVRRWKQWLVLPTLGGLFLAACQSAPEPAIVPPPPPPVPTNAQLAALEAAHVYTYVEQMPQLPGTTGMAAILQAIQAKLKYPALAEGAQLDGRVFVKFTVAADGSVRDVELVKGLAPAYDEAVMDAVRQLPTFEPGRQSGKAVNVSFTVPVMFKKQ